MAEDPGDPERERLGWFGWLMTSTGRVGASIRISFGIAIIAVGVFLFVGVDDAGELGFWVGVLGAGAVWSGIKLLRPPKAPPDPPAFKAPRPSFKTWNSPPAWKGAPERSDIPVVTIKEAREQLGLRTKFAVHLRHLGGCLEPCWNAAGDRCFTQASVTEEKRWWAESTPSARRKRRFTQWVAVLASG